MAEDPIEQIFKTDSEGGCGTSLLVSFAWVMAVLAVLVLIIWLVHR